MASAHIHMLRVELLTVLLHGCEGVATGRQLLMMDVQEEEEFQVGNTHTYVHVQGCMGRSLRLHGEVVLGVLESMGGRGQSWRYVHTKLYN